MLRNAQKLRHAGVSRHRHTYDSRIRYATLADTDYVSPQSKQRRFTPCRNKTASAIHTLLLKLGVTRAAICAVISMKATDEG